MKPLAVSLVMHGAVVASGAWILGHEDGDPVETNTYPVALIEPPHPGSIGEPGRGADATQGAPLPALRPVPKPPVAEPEPVKEITHAPSPPIVPAEASSTHEGQGTAGSSEGEGSGGGGTGEGTGRGSGGGGGAPEETFQPPRLLAGALPLDPDDVIAHQVPAEIPVRLRVGPDGRVKEIVPEIEHLPPPVLNALQRSADAMRFAPARRSGKPVEGWFSMSFVYRR